MALLRVAGDDRKVKWMRIAGALAVVGLALAAVACGGDGAAVANPGGDDTGTADPTPAPSSSTGTTIACAPDGAQSFDATCPVERVEVEGKILLTVFHPDGGFRRFEQLPDGSGLAAVAGADAVTQTLSGDILEVSLAGNRYRFPATTR
ncbi:MAG: hypothetical protein VX072_06405 [Pseudomonadota bacterium]|nr:hypothetical protein [Pseudomonadota bacterium]